MLYVTIVCTEDTSKRHTTQNNYEVQKAYFDGAVTALERVFKTKAEFTEPNECNIKNYVVSMHED